MNFFEQIEQEQVKLKDCNRLRILREISSSDYSQAEMHGKTYCNFSGNDYLGIAGNNALKDEFFNKYKDELPLLSSSSSRLLTGSSPEAMELEESLEKLYNRSALVFNSGYHANVGILPAISTKDDLILSDKLNHASIIDGMRLSDAKFLRYSHLNYQQLEKMLLENKDKYKNIFIISESIFSMDGDLADIVKLVELKEKYNAILLIDEAHAVGVRGEKGRGLANEQGVEDKVDILIGTLGKALGSIGAYAICDKRIKEFLINHVRSFIFSTALPPISFKWSTFALEKSMSMDNEREKLKRLSDKLRKILEAKNIQTFGNSQIVPLIVGTDHAAVNLAEKFQEKGFLVFAVRPPTVPVNSSRLRFSLSAALSDSDIEKIGELL